MKTVRRLLYVDVVSAVVFVAIAFLSLFFFIDFVDELGDVNKDYSAMQAALYSLLELPGHLYELAPIAVLIGTIYALSRLAQSSEFTILRTGGLGPGRALSLLMGLGIAFGVLTFLVGDYLAPLSERAAAELHARVKGGLSLGRAGAWMKDRVNTPDGERTYSINVATAAANGELLYVRIYAFDAEGRLVQRIAADSGRVGADATWTLNKVVLTDWSGASGAASADTGSLKVDVKNLDTYRWQSTLAANVVASAVLPVNSMSTFELFRYIAHLSDNEQTAQRYELRFWKRALYPLACLVMVGLALPFAYLHARAGGVSLKVFGGIMLGISFVLMNNVAAHIGLLKNWTPWIVAATPSLIYLLLSLAAFSWLVRYR
ncbi:LPS export ABC transporter permease LptG [Rhizobacter sp. Root1221]|uniref:LPS export ABC transporter permease LptG n=1 Tax=Rhizobacter sp. Root1221 TaxID=1736433 RepID=UPI0006FF8C51|nr:LPS export ABC transporter permease LptG [Rhizobacter sp. Root1221]KQW03021.1 LPS export ABC transporter permease LptG [Rhizobacter sp. Root1221]